jgi:hypothetical protein
MLIAQPSCGAVTRDERLAIFVSRRMKLLESVIENQRVAAGTR